MQYTAREVYEYISKKTNDPILERRTCSKSWTKFALYKSDKTFFEKISKTINKTKFVIPFPTLCPEERQRKRYSFRNQRNFYKRTCDYSWAKIISIYSPESDYIVYKQDIRWSDMRDPLSYWRSFDFSKTFNENFHLLTKQVPHNSLYSSNGENSDYTNFALDNKDCYLVTWGGNNHSCLYCDIMSWWISNIDCLAAFDSQHCFECTWIKKCSYCLYTSNSHNCSHCVYVEECNGCRNCLFSYGLINKQYYFLNKFVWKKKFLELKKNIAKLVSQSSSTLVQYHKIKASFPRVVSHNIRSEQSRWEGIHDSSDCHFWFHINNCQDCSYVSFLHNAVWSQDIDYASPHWANHSYNLCSSTWTCHSIGTFLCWNNHHIYYSWMCLWSSNLFWCAWVRNNSYCIFNTQYPKHEYEKKISKIVWHMKETQERGEFFDPNISPFWYQETVGQENMPLTKGRAEKLGYVRKDSIHHEKITPNIQTLHGDQLNKNKIQDNLLLSAAIICIDSWKPFRILRSELEFYRKNNLSLPITHPNQRYQKRISKRPSRSLHLRTCDKTWEKILSLYPQDVPFKVYSEKAYTQEIYS